MYIHVYMYVHVCTCTYMYIHVLDAQDGLKPVLELKPTASAISWQPCARANAKQMCRAKAHCRRHPLFAPLGLKPPSQKLKPIVHHPPLKLTLTAQINKNQFQIDKYI